MALQTAPKGFMAPKTALKYFMALKSTLPSGKHLNYLLLRVAKASFSSYRPRHVVQNALDQLDCLIFQIS